MFLIQNVSFMVWKFTRIIHVLFLILILRILLDLHHSWTQILSMICVNKLIAGKCQILLFKANRFIWTLCVIQVEIQKFSTDFMKNPLVKTLTKNWYSKNLLVKMMNAFKTSWMVNISNNISAEKYKTMNYHRIWMKPSSMMATGQVTCRIYLCSIKCLPLISFKKIWHKVLTQLRIPSRK